jgi:NAD(P)-dependent dehydrogenase (short-subunit alcohol dehydrogenase family)
LAAAFARHQEVFGKLDICINNAGIVGGTQPFHESDTWRNVIGINLVGLIDGTSKAVSYPIRTPFMIIPTYSS